jgi:hypothetical protein
MVEMTACQIRRLRERVRAEQTKMAEERARLTTGAARITERLATLSAEMDSCEFMVARLGGALTASENHPRGWKGDVPDPDGFPKYNPHRRLAVMCRSFL